MPRMTRMVLVALFLVSSLVLPLTPNAPASAPALRQATPVIIDFEDLTTTTSGTGGQTVVSDQYADLGVTFNDPLALDFAGGTFGVPDFVHSGSNAIQKCYSQEFCETPLVMTFSEPQRRVKVWVGFDGRLDEALVVRLSAFDAVQGGAEILSASATLGPSDARRIPVETPLEGTADGNAIRRVEVGFSPASSFASSLIFDDIEFERTSATPDNDEGTDPGTAAAECPAGATPPGVFLEHSGRAEHTQQNEVSLIGRTRTSTPLEEVTITAAGPGGIRSMDRTAAFVPTADDPFAFSIKEILLPGENTVSITVQNCAGTATDELTMIHTPVDEDTRYELMGVEVTQTIQDLANSVPLIAGKRTFVRVYLRTTEESTTLEDVTGRLPMCLDPEGDTPRCLAEDAVFESVDSLVAAVVDSGTDPHLKRQRLATSLTFEIPANLTAPGELHLALGDLTLSPDFPCDGCNTFVPNGDLEFIEAPPLLLNVVPVRYRAGGAIHTPGAHHRVYLESWLERAYPISEIVQVSDVIGIDIELLAGAPVGESPAGNYSICHDITKQLFTDALTRANQSRNLSSDPRTRYIGLISTDGGAIPGCAPDNTNFALAPAGTGEMYKWDKDGSYADFSGGHELAHTFDRKHPGWCPYNSEDDTVASAFADGAIAQNERMFYGFDAGDASIGGMLEDPQPYRGDIWRSLMSYCPDRWISAHTYQNILLQNQIENPSVVEGPPPVEEIVVTAAAVEDAPQPDPGVLLVVGTINLATQTVELDPFSLLPGSSVTLRPDQSDFTIVLLGDKDGKKNVELETYPFEPKLYTDQLPGAEDFALLGEVVPWVDGTKTISIRAFGRELDSRDVSNNPPTVDITFPNGGETLDPSTSTVTWDRTDVTDGDDVTYSLLYSTDKGATWHSVAGGLKDQQYTVDLSLLPGSDSALYRVIATDGVYTGQDDSDAVFSVPNNSPTVRIVSPAGGSTFGASQTLVLVGRGQDVEQGNLDGPSLQWSSDIDGALGAGRSISAKNLTPGFHTITLTATDDDGMTEVETLRIEIVDDDLPTLTWDPAIDISDAPQGHFSYDSDAGSGTVYMSDGNGGIQQLRSFDRFLNGWTAIVPGNFGGDDELTDLLLYSAQPGLGEFYASDGEGGLRLLSGAESFTRGWDFVVPGDFGGDDDLTDLFFYDLQEPVGKFYTTDGEGRIRLLGTSKALLTGWTSVVAGDFGGDGHTDLLFYDKEKGLARFYASDGQGGVELLSEDPAWTKGWDQIVAGNFDDDDWTDLFLYDDETRTVKFFATDGNGGIEQLGATETLLSRWTTIIGGDFGGDDTFTDLFFYDKAGRGKYYTTDGSGGLDQLSSSDAFATGWDLIVPGHFAGS